MRSNRPLFDALSSLAGSPDDDSFEIDQLLVRIAALSASLVGPADFASITAERDGTYTTVALSHQTALTIDLAQYADQAGPCLDALDGGTAVSAVISTTMAWPRFRQAADDLGIRASLSIPLFAGSGLPVAALNLYARDSNALAPLSAAILALYDVYGADQTSAEQDESLLAQRDPGSSELLAGVAEAFAVQHQIHVALGVLMHRSGDTAGQAYTSLQERAAGEGVSLLNAAGTVVATSC